MSNIINAKCVVVTKTPDNYDHRSCLSCASILQTKFVLIILTLNWLESLAW